MVENTTVDISDPKSGTIQVHVVDNTPDVAGFVMIHVVSDGTPIWLRLSWFLAFEPVGPIA